MTSPFVRPAVAAMLILLTCAAIARARPASFVERRRDEEGDPRFRREGDEGRRRPISSNRPSASPRSTTTARCGASSRCTSSRCSPSTASRRWRRSIRNGRTSSHSSVVLEGDIEGVRWPAARGRCSRSSLATHAGMTTDEFDTIVKEWLATAKHPTIQAAVHRVRLSADARAAGVPARQRLQDVHRVRRRHRVHARRGPRRVYGIPPEQVIGSSGKT